MYFNTFVFNVALVHDDQLEVVVAVDGEEGGAFDLGVVPEFPTDAITGQDHKLERDQNRLDVAETAFDHA